MSTASQCELENVEKDLEVPRHQMQCVTRVKQWVENEAEFYGRSDDYFLLMFLRACEFDVEYTKTTLTKYYRSRRDIPQWWANRSFEDNKIRELIPTNSSIGLLEKDGQPGIVITRFTRFLLNSAKFDDFVKIGSMNFEITARRKSTQLHGLYWIADCKDGSWRLVYQIISAVKNFIYSFYSGAPIRLQSVFVINAPYITQLLKKAIDPFADENLREKIHFYGGDYSELCQYLDMEMLPEEYGGSGGPIKDHENAFAQEAKDYVDYFEDDKKYGYR